jgi:hypothetical protein
VLLDPAIGADYPVDIIFKLLEARREFFRPIETAMVVIYRLSFLPGFDNELNGRIVRGFRGAISRVGGVGVLKGENVRFIDLGGEFVELFPAQGIFGAAYDLRILYPEELNFSVSLNGHRVHRTLAETLGPCQLKGEIRGVDLFGLEDRRARTRENGQANNKFFHHAFSGRDGG